MKVKLEIELVPSTAWYSNVRSNVSKSEWDRLRKKCYKAANYKCEICGGKGHKHPVECHEIWSYDDRNQIQKLEGLISLCPSCHQVKHFGLSSQRGLAGKCFKHIAKVNNISATEASKMVTEAFDKWEDRSQHNWQLDITFLNNY